MTLTKDENQRRRQAVIDGHRDGLTARQVAETIDLSPSRLRCWITEHAPELAFGKRLPQVIADTRAAIYQEGVEAGTPMAEMAVQAGLTRNSWTRWCRENLGYVGMRPRNPEPEPQPAVGIVSSRASLAGWVVSCEPCDRLFVRRERRRADWLAEKHAIMHGLDQHVTCRDGSVWRAAA